MIKNIHYLEVRIEPFLPSYSLGTKILKFRVKVNGEIYSYHKPFEDNDFEDRFYLLMRYAEEAIREKVKEQK